MSDWMICPMSPDRVDEAARALADVALLTRYGTTGDRLKSALFRAIETPDVTVLAAFSPSSGKPGPFAGLCWFAPGGTFLLGGYLKLLVVAKPFQRKGVGRALVREMEQAVSPRSANLFLLVSDFNTGGARFYESLGYVRVGRIPRLVLPDVDELIYHKSLLRDLTGAP